MRRLPCPSRWGATAQVHRLCRGQQHHGGRVAQALEGFGGGHGRVHAEAHHILVVLLGRQGMDGTRAGHLANGAGQAGDAQLHAFESGIDARVGHQVRGQAAIELVVHQQGEQRIGPDGFNREIQLERVQEPGDVAAIDVAGAVQIAGFRIDQRIVVGRIDFPFDDGARRIQRFPGRAEALRHTAQRVAALNKRFGDESAAIEQIADVRRHGDLARMALALVNPGPIGLGGRLERLNGQRHRAEQSAQHAPRVHPDERGESGHFTNEALGFTSTASLSANPNPQPQVVASINPLLNTLSAGQIATINSNLPSVDGIGLLPVLANDTSLKLEQQTFWYPFSVQFANDNAFAALTAPEVAIITLTATFTVGPITLTASANIELAAGEDPRFEDYTPSNPLAYPPWLSFDLRFFKVTPNQPHKWFNVPNPANAAGCVTYIQSVLSNLNTPGTNLNGDTFDTSLSQDEEQSALEFFPANSTTGDLTFNFAVARVHIKSTVTETTPVMRVFFRLFQAASTVSNFIEVGTGQGTYRWGTNGTPGHKIPLLGVQTDQNGNLEYVTIPCFATARVNLGTPTDMNQQTDPPNAHPINTIANTEVDTYFGCWLDVNQTGGANNFLILTPPTTPSQWDGPWTGTESINGAINVAPHQCVIAEIRYDDTPIPTNATSATTDKLAQRNIAWIDGPNPGTDPSRLMSHPCEIRASVSNDAADELMITWGTTPKTGTASLYLPAVSSADILNLANAMYPAHLLSILDPNTIQFPSNSMTLVPVPAGTGRYAGLLSVNLPPHVHKGDEFNIAVRQFENISTVVPTPPP